MQCLLNSKNVRLNQFSSSYWWYSSGFDILLYADVTTCKNSYEKLFVSICYIWYIIFFMDYGISLIIIIVHIFLYVKIFQINYLILDITFFDSSVIILTISNLNGMIVIMYEIIYIIEILIKIKKSCSIELMSGIKM